MPGIFDPAPYHVLSYGTLLGTQIFQSFIGGPVAFKTLPRPQFAVLQAGIFPVYFSIQTALPVVLALTLPGEKPGLSNGASGVSALLAPENRYTALVPLVTMFVSGLVNLAFIGPATTKIMRQRKSQEARDGKKSYDAPPHSPEMQRLNKAFGKIHGISSLVNLAGLIATIYYGTVLAGRVQ